MHDPDGHVSLTNIFLSENDANFKQQRATLRRSFFLFFLIDRAISSTAYGYIYIYHHPPSICTFLTMCHYPHMHPFIHSLCAFVSYRLHPVMSVHGRDDRGCGNRASVGVYTPRPQAGQHLARLARTPEADRFRPFQEGGDGWGFYHVLVLIGWYMDWLGGWLYRMKRSVTNHTVGGH